jgi:acylglycerol lipase
MTTAAGTFTGAGGVAIHFECTTPAEPPRGAVLLSHGYGEHIGRYGYVVRHLAGRGLAVAALDHRGHGRSGGPRGHCRDFGEYVADLHTLANEAERRWPGVPRVLLGHSLGGLIGLLYLLRHPDDVRAAVLSAPALRVPRKQPRVLEWAAQVLAMIAPQVSFTADLDATALSRDPAVGPAYVADPLVHNRASAGFFVAFGRAQAMVVAEAPHVRVPALLLQGDADRIVDPTAAGELAARLGGVHELVMLAGYYHELLNEPPAERRRVLDLTDAWFDRWRDAR